MSKLIKCKACGKEIAKRSICSNCGKDHRNFFVRHKILTVLALLSMVIVGLLTNAYTLGQSVPVILVILAALGYFVDMVKPNKVRVSDKSTSTINADSSKLK
ncbi:putative OB-fold protein [Clostridium acetobutylicum]|uniref:Uncharacterized, Zn-finger domain containing protein, YXKC B.subtilis homolog n=1 Tax=Clostridium acetobutylicum (strain ATCC 824 / DSM 792 / JCM 1419 / IAM 19013 / LMG 5710 / NBRC 13948 / NRRL B-527 / VKM B-1787 / 2291 / W) TaxID=272562 RepID=Q97CZ2_CLOAB|nr:MULTISPECIES: hypothetical protein [Clostridium]AAK81618.1 Uncharacterized, Zn-finger domain containing protein, YXKC B.subtilis homolog [Clostridium acetobutylicum ATCC 824]ADZ22740.1 Conserved hypothetical protein [Clostridium acetobutylicum EA 2018]AEI32995.1 hypothetical protein SMB_G3739 [Clostridium acetobutylicum DSM 1731]AWV80708.1 hypothetical protein DK921_11475 [Clostridium acetobutylicum]MBC2393967.1 hypothetical protein [Clostridium acetobutylicum]